MKKILVFFTCMLMILTSISILVSANKINIGTNNYNTPPNPPEVTGPINGQIKQNYIYYVTISDPDEDLLLRIEVDFGDGITEVCGGCTTRPWQSGETVPVDHQWSDTGNFAVSARVQDEHGVWSDWSDPLSVTMPKYRAFNSNFPSLLYKIFSLFQIF